MRVIVTRPPREAQQWVRDLSARGLDAVALPLIKVAAVADPAGLRQAWQHLDDHLALMFVSGNAADYFFAANPLETRGGSAFSVGKTRAWATGPGTAAALLRQGVAPERLDVPARNAGQFDSEALWHVVAAQVRPGDRVLIVRGGDPVGQGGAGQGVGREWFARRLADAGARADFVVAYQREVPVFSAQQRQRACAAASDGTIWLFSSAQAVAHLCAWLPGQDWAAARALATHPRIAAAAKLAGFGVVCESRPMLADVVGSIESMG